jgi:hypothetical protein
MKPSGGDGRVDALLFAIGASVSVFVLAKQDNEFLAGALGLSVFLALSLVYAIVARLVGLPRMKLENFVAGVVALLP